jgi:DNA-binding transcriptional MerR regulator
MYIGTLKGGVSTCHYDNELEYARQRFGKKPEVRSETECFKNHTETHSKTMVRFIEALKDGRLSLEEIKSIEECLNDEETNLQMIRTMLNFKKSLLEEKL